MVPLTYARLVPVLANGFGDLNSRRAWQDELQAAQKAKLADLEARITSLLTRQDLDVTAQLQIIQKQQLKLALRILQLMRQVETMRRAGTKISPQEQAFLGRIQEIAQRLSAAPLGTGHVNRLASQASSLAESGRLDPLASARHQQVASGESLDTLYSVLKQQQQGIAALIETINKNSRDLDNIRFGFSSSI